MKPGKVFLLTGLSGAGKTTLATALLQTLSREGRGSVPGHDFVFLDGDILRHGLCSDLGYTPEARKENIRRAGEMAKLLSSQGYHVLMAFIAPYETVRRQLADIAGQENLRVVHVSCPLEVCIIRDPKRHYQKALLGRMANYTGIADVYEAPENAHLTLKTNEQSLEQCVRELREFVRLETGS